MGLLHVFIGGGLGAVARYGLSLLIPGSPSGFPIATFITNLLSCILLGYLIAALSSKQLNPSTQLLLVTGFCGGFSTFSTFTGESFKLLQEGQSSTAIVYIAASIGICLIGFWLGIKIHSAS